MWSLEISGGTRRCANCNYKIRKGTKYLLNEWQGGMYKQHNNYCPVCSIKVLKNNIKDFVKMLNAMVKYIRWDR